MMEPLVSAPTVASDRPVPASSIRRPTIELAAGWPTALAAAAGLVASGWVATLLIGRVEGLSAPPYDLAFFQQIVWNIGHNGAWVSSFHEGSFLGLHLSPFLVVPSLVERLVGVDVRVLNGFHAVAVGALAPAAFVFLRAAFRPSPAAAALAAGLAIPIPIWGAMQEVIRSDFHPEAAGVVLALLAGWAGLTSHPRTMWALAVVALATREDTSYAVALIGLVVAARGRGAMRRHGRALTVCAVAWAVVAFGVLMPTLGGGTMSDTAHYYAWLGGGLGVLIAPFTMTDRVVAALTRPEPWFVVIGMTLSLLGLPLLRPRWAMLLLPPLAALLLSAHWFQADIRLHYPLILVVPLLVAASFGGRRAIAMAVRVGRRGGRRPRSRSRSDAGRRDVGAALPLLALIAALPAIAGAWIQGSIPPFDHGDPAFFHRPRSIDRVQSVAGRVPPSALLLADEGLLAPLAGRSAVGRMAATAVMPNDAYILTDLMAWTPTREIARRHEQNVTRLRASARPVLVDDGRFVLWGPDPELP